MASHKLTCVQLALITNVLIERGLTSFGYMIKYREKCPQIWCEHCKAAMIKICYGTKNMLYDEWHDDKFPISDKPDTFSDMYINSKIACHFRFVIPRADIIRLLSRGDLISPRYLEHCNMIDREISLLLLRNNIFIPQLSKYVDGAEVKAQLIHAASITHNDAVIKNKLYPEIYDAHTLDMVLIELNSGADHAAIADRYFKWGIDFASFSHELQNTYKDRFEQTYPIIILRGYHLVRKAINSFSYRSYDNLVDLIDRIMAFSDDPVYIKYLAEYLSYFIMQSNGSYIFSDELRLLIANKHPRYLDSVLNSYEISAWAKIFAAHQVAYNNKEDLIWQNITHDNNLLIHLPEDKLCDIGAERLNKYIRDHYQMADVDLTLSDIYKVRFGVDLSDADISRSMIHVKRILYNINFDFEIKHNGTAAENKISFDHILARGRNNAAFLNKVRDDDMLARILPTMYDEFIRGMCSISAICAQYMAPQDVVDLIRLYYINGRANDADIGRMLMSFAE
jgi:hypothetical protein